MFKIVGHDIRITRGDTGVVHVSVFTKKGVQKTPYEFLPDDIVTLTVRKEPKKFNDEDEVLIQQMMDMETQDITIQPEDTARIEYGTYNYDIQLLIGGTVVNTISVGKFIITHEFT